MDKTGATRAAGKAHGIEVAEACVFQVSADGVSDTNEAFAALLARHIGTSARELEAKGMPDQLVQIWMDAAVKAGVARLRELSHVLNQPKQAEH